jgi:hypothetical protein
MTDKNKRIIEIDGVKLEVDLREAKQVDKFKVGQNVKVLVEEYDNDFRAYPGAIIGFDNFKNKPTIVVIYLKADYSGAEIEYAYICEGQKKRVEIVPVSDEEISFNKGRIIDLLNSEIETKKQKLKDVEAKKAYFLKHFDKMFKD